MTVDARGGLWLDNPLLVLGLLILLWVLIASLHTDPWLRWQRYPRQLVQFLLHRCHGVRVVLERAGQVGVVRPHPKVAVAGPVGRRRERGSAASGRAAATGWASFRFDGDDARRPTLAQLVAQERKCQAREARPAANVAASHVGVLPCSIHLLEGFLSDHRLVQQDVVQRRAQ